MKPLPLMVFLIVLITPAAAGAVETDATVLDTLVVDIWPDYDKAEVLVLLTGTLPGDSQLPARVTLPLMASARIHAVARIDARDGVMKDDILASPGLEELTLITPDPVFRVEYYFPYTAKGSQRAFDFKWQAELAVAKLQLKVQQPAASSSFRTAPAGAYINQSRDGLTYYTFPVRSLPAGQPFELHVDYVMDQPGLSKQSLPAPIPDTTPVPAPNPVPAPLPAPTQNPAGSGISWPVLVIVGGCGLIFLAVIWMVVTRYFGAVRSGGR